MAKKIAWTDQAKADVRGIDRETAIDLLHRLACFLTTEERRRETAHRYRSAGVPFASRRLPPPLLRPRRLDRDPSRSKQKRSLPVIRNRGGQTPD